MRQQTRRKTTVTENTRTAGTAIWTPLSTLPERFIHGPHTETMGKYLARRWSADSYGWYKRTGKGIEYNQEWTPHTDGLPRYRADDRRFRWVEHPSDGLRYIGKAHEIRGSGDGNLPYFDRALINHHGWYVDNYQDEKVCGEVYQLPSRDGKAQYVPAIEDHNGNDGAILDFHSVTDDLRDAVRWADSMAERYAEDEREYQAKDAAASRIEEIDAEVKTAREEFKSLCRELRANCDAITGMKELRKLVRRALRSMRSETRELRVEKRKLQDNFWTAVPQ